MLGEPTARFALNLLLDDDGRLLLLERSREARLGPGLWGLPAGRIEPGESAEQAARREMDEEIGPGHEVTLQRYIGPIRDTYYGGQYEIHLFHYRWHGGTVRLNHEHTAWAWVAPERYRDYPTMDGIDEDIALLGLWPQRYLDPARVPAALREAPVATVELACESLGEGPPVVVLHGLFGAGRNWLTVARRLAAEFRFHLVDLRNHGRSPHTASMTYRDMAADVRALVGRLGLDDFTLVGHSMGGKAAMTLALDDGAGIARLVAVDIAPIAYPDRFAEMIAALRGYDLAGVRRRAEADAALAPAIPDEVVRQFILQNLVFEDGTARWRANFATLEAEMPHILGPLPVAPGAHFDRPAWFIRGELSDRVDGAALAVIARRFPAWRLETVAGGGHWPHAEAPTAFLECFRAALRA